MAWCIVGRSCMTCWLTLNQRRLSLSQVPKVAELFPSFYLYFFNILFASVCCKTGIGARPVVFEANATK